MKRKLLLLLGVYLLSASVTAQDDFGDLRNTSDPTFSGQRAFEHVANHVGVGFRQTATPGSYAAGNLILNHLEALGWDTNEDWHMLNLGDYNQMDDASRQTLADWQPVDVAPLLRDTFDEITGDGRAPELDDVIVPVRNLVARYGTGETIIIGAHYDSRIYSDKDPDPTKRFDPMPGANDGGSGVGVLLELARAISAGYTPNVELRFVFFDAEDNGRIPPFTNLQIGAADGYIVGSSFYAASLDPSTESIRYMLLLDLVGEADQAFPIESYSYQSAAPLVDAIWATAADLGYAQHFPTEQRGFIIDDHLPFIQRGVPSVDIIDLDYAHWHTSNDTLDKLDPDSLGRVGHVVLTFLEQTGAITRNPE